MQASLCLTQQIQHRERNTPLPPAGVRGNLHQLSKARYQRHGNAGGRQSVTQLMCDRSHHSFRIGDLVERAVYERYGLNRPVIRTSREVEADFR
ncbi:hypothetical protein ACWF9B_25790 [Streptomyces sp. NPDC055089]